MGCFNTILLGGSIFTISLVGLTSAVQFQAVRVLLLPLLFVLVPLGYGLLTANVNVFGSHQFAEEKDKTSWFSWFYFCINIGSVLAFLIPGMIQQSYSFSVGLALPCAIVTLGLCMFASKHSVFVHP